MSLQISKFYSVNFIQASPAILTGAPRSSIITCLPFSVKFTNISSLNSSHQFTFKSSEIFFILSQSTHLHAIHAYFLFLFLDGPLAVPLFLSFEELLLPLDRDLMSLEKLLCLSLLPL